MSLSLSAALAIAAAPFVGSFLGLVAWRLPRGEPLIWSRSACRACGARLGLRDLVPVISWIALGGRCRHCGGGVSLSYPVIELAATAIALWSVMVVPDSALAWSCALGWTLVVLSAIDLATLTLPDRLTFPLAAAGLAFATITHGGTAALEHAAGMAAGGLAIIAVDGGYRLARGRAGLGLGDAKLAAAAGAWVGPWGLPTALVIATFGALGALVLLRAAGRRLALSAPIPFGPALCLGLWLDWLYGPINSHLG